MDYFELTERTEKNQRKGIEMVIFFFVKLIVKLWRKNRMSRVMIGF